MTVKVMSYRVLRLQNNGSILLQESSIGVTLNNGMDNGA